MLKPDHTIETLGRIDGEGMASARGEKPYLVYVVDPFGKIFDIPLRVTRSSLMLKVSHKLNRDKRPCGYRSIEISDDAKEAGFDLLYNMYEAEGWPEGYDAYVKWERSMKEAVASMRTVRPFPESHLPRKVLELRGKKGAMADAVELPAPPKAWSGDTEKKSSGSTSSRKASSGASGAA